MIEKIEVWLDDGVRGSLDFIGEIRCTLNRGKELFSFSYQDSWLSSHDCFQIDPYLYLVKGEQFSPQGFFGFAQDSSPDRWGRVLMRRREALLASREQRPEKNLYRLDFLLGSHDISRLGALRYRLKGQLDFLHLDDTQAIPPWARLRELQNASLALEEKDSEEDSSYRSWLSLLLMPGSSLGGARPKASVRDEKENLWIAKFPSLNDDINVGLWEYLVYGLAKDCGLKTCPVLIETFSNLKTTFLIQRFDRFLQKKRIHFASAMTLLGRNEEDKSSSSYLDILQFILNESLNPEEDALELWKRILFNIMVSNTDDHLRNHGFLRQGKGWSLSPLFDVNPNPYGQGLTLNISETDNRQDLDLIRSVAVYFRIDKQKADQIILGFKDKISSWKERATHLKISRSEQMKMEKAFRIAGSSLS